MSEFIYLPDVVELRILEYKEKLARYERMYFEITNHNVKIPATKGRINLIYKHIQKTRARIEELVWAKELIETDIENKK